MEPKDGLDARHKATLSRLNHQIHWYERQKNWDRNAYHLLKLLQIIAAAAVPVLTSTNLAANLSWVVGALGAFVVATEGIQQLGRYHEGWLRCAQTEEALKRERYLYGARAGDYANVDEPERLLAERIEDLISRETGTWATSELKTEVSAQD